MLYELKDIQKEGEPSRRIFEDPEMDLIVWYDSPVQHEIIGFQLAYGKKNISEKALTWYRERGFTHEKVDDPIFIGPKMTPLLLPDGVFPADDVISLFMNESKNLEPSIREFVLDKMKELRDQLKEDR